MLVIHILCYIRANFNLHDDSEPAAQPLTKQKKMYLLIIYQFDFVSAHSTTSTQKLLKLLQRLILFNLKLSQFIYSIMDI